MDTPHETAHPYHVCFTVPVLEDAMREFTAATGVSWHPPAGGRIADTDYRIVFTRGGPPLIELIEAPPGGPWGDTSEPGFHHLGWWTTDVSAGSSRLSGQGFTEEFSGCPYGRPFAYHRLPGAGARIELVDAGAQPGFLDTWNPGGAPMPAIQERDLPWNG